MSQLLYYAPGRFQQLANDYPDVKIWLAIFKVFIDNVSFVDRSGIITPPIRTANAEWTRLPAPDSNFNLSFDQCAVNRAQEIYNQYLKLGARIKFSWSGGIDSTAGLMAFIELLGVARTREIMDIVMTQIENPYVWEQIVRRENFNIVNAMEFKEKWDGSEILVNGECGDQIHGTDIYRALRTRYGSKSLTIPWTRDLVLEHIKWKAKDLTEKEYEILTDLFVFKVQQAPISIDSLADFWWWLNFSCKWGSVIYRIISKSPHSVDQAFLKQHFFSFYASDDFQQWAMLKREEKHQGDWETYKWRAKKFIVDVSGCKELNFKHRQGSLTQVLTHTARYDAIDSDFNFYKSINPEDWYNPNNSFSNRLI
jgi:hypothetical protein